MQRQPLHEHAVVVEAVPGELVELARVEDPGVDRARVRGVEDDDVVALLGGPEVRAPVVDDEPRARIVEHAVVHATEALRARDHGGLEIDDRELLDVVVLRDGARRQARAEADDGDPLGARRQQRAEVAEQREGLIVDEARGDLVDAVHEELPLAVDLVAHDRDGRAPALAVDLEVEVRGPDLAREHPAGEGGRHGDRGERERGEQAPCEGDAARVVAPHRGQAPRDGRAAGERGRGALDPDRGHEQERREERSDQRADGVRGEDLARAEARAVGGVTSAERGEDGAGEHRGGDDRRRGEDGLQHHAAHLGARDGHGGVDREHVEAVGEVAPPHERQRPERDDPERAEERGHEAIVAPRRGGEGSVERGPEREAAEHRREHRAERVHVVPEHDEEDACPHRLEAEDDDAAHQRQREDCRARKSARLLDGILGAGRRRGQPPRDGERQRERDRADPEVDAGGRRRRRADAPSAEEHVAGDDAAERGAGGVERVDEADAPAHAVGAVGEDQLGGPRERGEGRAEQERGGEHDAARDREAHDEGRPARPDRAQQVQRGVVGERREGGDRERGEAEAELERSVESERVASIRAPADHEGARAHAAHHRREHRRGREGRVAEHHREEAVPHDLVGQPRDAGGEAEGAEERSEGEARGRRGEVAIRRGANARGRPGCSVRRKVTSGEATCHPSGDARGDGPGHPRPGDAGSRLAMPRA